MQATAWWRNRLVVHSAKRMAMLRRRASGRRTRSKVEQVGRLHSFMVDEWKGNLFRVGAMDANAGVVEVGDGGGRLAVNELHGDGVGVAGGVRT